MRHAWLVLLAGFIACDDYDDGSGVDVEQVVLDVTSDHAIDTIWVIEARDGVDQPGIATPALVAAGTAPARGTVLARDVQHYDPISPPGHHDHFTIDVDFGRGPPEEYVVLGSLGGTIVSAAVIGGGFEHRYTLSIDAAALGTVETWGPANKLCVRIDGTSPAYVVDSRDHDCDGYADDADCDPRTYCDPASTDPRIQAACTVAMCQPCEDTTTGCALQSHAVCNDGPGHVHAVSCDSDGGCGEAICLPGDACEIDCGLAWPNTDPTSCVAEAWSEGATADDAIHCAFPTTNDMTCAGGSSVELALPYTGCTNPRAIFDAVTPTITPPCTLRVSLSSDEQLGPVPAVIAFDTDTTPATVRLVLDPTEGCGVVGTCEPIKSTATCQL